jgi:hypothetical protein
MAGELDVAGAQMKRFVLVLVLLLVLALGSAHAHVGSPTVFYQGQAGPYTARVVIKPAEVIPGLAEISVRVEGSGIERVTALPMKWNMGRQGAPPPDVAKPVRGETNLHTAELWFMEPGPHAVEIEITGAAGSGRVSVPVDAAAMRVLSMPKGLGVMLVVLGIGVLGLLVSIAGAAVRESSVEPGVEPTLRRRRWARVLMGGLAALLVLLLWGGKRWWEAEAADYRNNRLYRPVETRATAVNEDGRRILRLEVPDFSGAAPLVPDHGKLMHLFLMREPALDAFAHLHPVKRSKQTFEGVLPDLPTGRYRVYADVTYETGWSDTLTATVDLPEARTAGPIPRLREDADDSWSIGPGCSVAAAGGECQLSPGCFMRAEGRTGVRANQPTELRFAVHDADSKPVVLESYLGMRGHLVLSRTDGAVYTHLHPGGSASMAAMQLSTLRAEGKLPLRAAFGKEDPLCELPAPGPAELSLLRGRDEGQSTVSFPYAFPKPGTYRLWVQVKVGGEVKTGVWDVVVE